MRILKGYSKEEQKELEDAKRKYMNGGDLFHVITGFLPDTRCGLIWKKYDKADKDERISIIKDILDFYNGKAKFTGSKKYYVHFIENDEYSYLNINSEGGADLGTKFGFSHWKVKFTRDEVVAIEPKLVSFMEDVEVDNKANQVQNETQRKQLNYLENKHMRILKGYSKDEQKELEYTKKNMSYNDLLHNITGFPADTRFNLIWEKYNEADTDKRISIIRDILDFYTDKATFIVPKKYYVQLIAGDEESYLNITPDGRAQLGRNLEIDGWIVKFTIDEIAKINPQLVLFMEEVEDDE